MGKLEKGLTLIELLAVLAILAILAMAGYQLVGLIPQTENASSATVFREAVRELYIQALTNEGALMTWNPATSSLQVTSLGVSPYTSSYQLSHSVQIMLNGKPFQCLPLNPKGFPDNSAVASCPFPNPTTPMQWSITNGSSTVSFQ